MDELYFEMMRKIPEKVKPEIKRIYRTKYKQTGDSLSCSIRDHRWSDLFACGQDPWRRVAHKDDWEGYYEYLIMPDAEGWEDEDIREVVKELEIHINSAYDCTGKLFTRWVSWSRTKAGIVIIRRMDLDV